MGKGIGGSGVWEAGWRSRALLSSPPAPTHARAAGMAPRLHAPPGFSLCCLWCVRVQWHDSLYLGAAHGLCGVLHVLLTVPDEVVDACDARGGGSSAAPRERLLQGVQSLVRVVSCRARVRALGGLLRPSDRQWGSQSPLAWPAAALRVHKRSSGACLSPRRLAGLERVPALFPCAGGRLLPLGKPAQQRGQQRRRQVRRWHADRARWLCFPVPAELMTKVFAWWVRLACLRHTGWCSGATGRPGC